MLPGNPPAMGPVEAGTAKGGVTYQWMSQGGAVSPSGRRSVNLPSAVPMYLRGEGSDYLKHYYPPPPHHPVPVGQQPFVGPMPLSAYLPEGQFVNGPSIRETKFQKGFYRRTRQQIEEMQRQQLGVGASSSSAVLPRNPLIPDQLPPPPPVGIHRHSIAGTGYLPTLAPFGAAPESERHGRKMVIPNVVFPHQGHEQDVRRRLSFARFYQWHESSPARQERLVNEGLCQTLRQSAVLGDGSYTSKSARNASEGAKDAFMQFRT
ncbi:unnamed protein product [Vitrella brassicaformis CCMP3155]|uniref:Uncharacterized protein n=2 Tax=Vitrella brassicaformis TaxID=1169539 RepID=A0A0G4G6V6_VITBC|nr:unnamed protein product [Vitrella brassicaformis CCMP3155]|mmetsp:Transcript_14995/g.35729  ORF Transcript_14995/g.35729 Transcript_14995/m.35729 type:complete len:263 (+) Transcript_14995:177-965(+)|eukprot:CEM24448.1 unnamed protein product [Vitrella brassicaformis CCMP3155]